MTYTDESFLGSGELYLDVFDTDGNRTGELDMGNATEFIVHAPEIETREILTPQAGGHLQASEQGCVMRGQQIGFTLTDINRENLALAMYGTAAVISQAAGNNTGSPESVTGYAGRWSKLTYRSLDQENPPVVRDETDTTTYVEGTDYEIDYQVGRIKVLSGGSIDDGDTLHVASTWLDLSGWQVTGDTTARFMASIRLVGLDKANGRNCEVMVHKAALSTSGDMAWLGSDMASLVFDGMILAVSDGTWRVLFT